MTHRRRRPAVQPRFTLWWRRCERMALFWAEREIIFVQLTPGRAHLSVFGMQSDSLAQLQEHLINSWFSRTEWWSRQHLCEINNGIDDFGCAWRPGDAAWRGYGRQRYWVSGQVKSAASDSLQRNFIKSSTSKFLLIHFYHISIDRVSVSQIPLLGHKGTAQTARNSSSACNAFNPFILLQEQTVYKVTDVTM